MKEAERLKRIQVLTKLAKVNKAKYEKTKDHADLVNYRSVLAELQKAKRIQEGYKDIMVFAKNYFTGEPPHDLLKADTPSPEFHYEITEELRKAILHPWTQKFAIAAPRSHAKSTIITNILPIWMICYLEDVQEYYVCIIGSSQDKAKQFLDVIKSELEDNQLLIADFGKLRGPTWNSLEIITKNGMKLSAHGAGESIRGVRFGSYRPSVILDDIESEESCSTPERIDKMMDWMLRTVLPLGDPRKSKFFLVGTVIHFNSVLNQILTNRPDFKAFRYQAIKRFPDRMDLWDEWEALLHSRTEGEDPVHAAQLARQKAMQFYQDNKEEMHEGAEVLWPERMTLLDLMEIRAQNRLAFGSEFQNLPVDEDSRVFKKYHLYKPEEVNIEDLEILGACDPSLGKSKRSDPSVILTVGRDRRTGIVYVLSIDRKRRNPDQLIQDIFAKAELHEYSKFSVESNAFQQFLKDEIQKRSAEAGIYLNVIEYKPGSTKKELRIASIEPMVTNGYIRFLPTQREVIDELETFPRSATDDVLDTLVQIAEMCRRRGGVFSFAKVSW